MISLTFNGTAAEVLLDMRAFLASTSLGNGATELASTAEPAAPKRQTAAEKKAADKAAAEAAAAEAAAAEAAKPVTAADKQDAKDEAADAKTAAPDPIKLTHDSVRAMLGGYVMAFGMEAAQADGAGLIGSPKISELKDDQAVFAKAVLGIANGIEKNPNKREIAGDGISAEKLAELKPLVVAALAVK